jgi:hypothetical protein
MPEKKRYLRLTLSNPQDVQEYIRRLLRNLKERGPDAEIEYLGRISQLLSVWLKSYELNKLDDIERRLAVLEKAKEGDHDHENQ